MDANPDLQRFACLPRHIVCDCDHGKRQPRNGLGAVVAGGGQPGQRAVAARTIIHTLYPIFAPVWMRASPVGNSGGVWAYQSMMRFSFATMIWFNIVPPLTRGHVQARRGARAQRRRPHQVLRLHGRARRHQNSAQTDPLGILRASAPGHGRTNGGIARESAPPGEADGISGVATSARLSASITAPQPSCALFV